MALYRTKPEEVEAIRYTGNMMTPFDGDVPDWVWAGLGAGVLKFSAHGLEITYSGISENVLPNDWMVMHNDGIIRACADKIFKTYYVRARKRIADRFNNDNAEA